LILLIISAILVVYGRENKEEVEFNKIAFYGNIISSIGLLLSVITYFFLKEK
jgi:hypothetical protein